MRDLISPNTTAGTVIIVSVLFLVIMGLLDKELHNGIKEVLEIIVVAALMFLFALHNKNNNCSHNISKQSVIKKDGEV